MCEFISPPEFRCVEIEQVFQVVYGYSEQSKENFLRHMWSVTPKIKSRSFHSENLLKYELFFNIHY